MSDRSLLFVLKLLTQPPLSLPQNEAEALAPDLRDFWASIADGDALFNFPQFPPLARRYFEKFGAIEDGLLNLIDNNITLLLQDSVE